MPIKRLPIELVKLLSDGEFHSGEVIGELLGVSRAAIWKRLQKLEELGLTVESVKGKGYRLVEPITLLEEEVINALSSVPDVQGSTIVHLDLDSTNAEMMRKIAMGDIAKGDVIVAESQKAGRGRRGRNWISPFAQNIYYSKCWSFEGGAAALEGLSLVVGIQLVEVLTDLGVEGVKLKWPNDLLVGGRKLAGILLEITGDPNGLCYVIVGIGINVNMKQAAGTIDQPWTSVCRQLNADINRNELIAQMNRHLQQGLQEFSDKGFVAFSDRWRELDAYADEEVVVKQGDDQRFGIARGVNDKGELLVEIGAQLQAFNGGEVSLRRRL